MSRPDSLAGLRHQAMPAFVLRAGRVDHKPISSAFSCFVGVAKRHEKLFRNIPILTSLKVSPFRVLLLSGSLALPRSEALFRRLHTISTKTIFASNRGRTQRKGDPRFFCNC